MAEHQGFRIARTTPGSSEATAMRPSRRRPWVVVLAGGEGTRVRSLTRDRRGRPAPKQYAAIGGERTLIAATLARAARITSTDRIVPVVAEHHERWWRCELTGELRANAVVQPASRGTAAGVLMPLLRILDRDPDAIVVTMPSDHAVELEDPLIDTVMRAVDEVDRFRLPIVVLGVESPRPENGYGWIVPSSESRDRPLRVAAFREKPGALEAASLLDGGAMINTMIIAAEGRCLLALFKTEAPELWRRCERRWSAPSPRLRRRGDLVGLYRSIPQLDFSKDVLEPAGKDLWVHRVPPCGWTDLGTPARLAEHQSSNQPLSSEPARQSGTGMDG
jgi:mannose-1-phosphate guanylyltransferase